MIDTRYNKRKTNRCTLPFQSFKNTSVIADYPANSALKILTWSTPEQPTKLSRISAQLA